MKINPASKKIIFKINFDALHFILSQNLYLNYSTLLNYCCWCCFYNISFCLYIYVCDELMTLDKLKLFLLTYFCCSFSSFWLFNTFISGELENLKEWRVFFSFILFLSKTNINFLWLYDEFDKFVVRRFERNII